MSTAPFELAEPPRQETCVVFASPHSGRDYAHGFLRRTQLSESQIRSSEDAFVDQLFDAAPRYGAPLLAARAPRAYVDLNRASDELDPALIEGVRRALHNPRVASGLGVVPRVVAGGRPIYRGKITLDEARARIRDVWRPYHEKLQDLLNRSRLQFGEAVLIDCHSMPHEAIESIAARCGRRPDVVLGDRFGAAAAPDVVEAVESAFREAGFVVVRNAPFAGAYIAQHYGRPSRRQHAVQIEIDRSLYMDEANVTPHAGYAEVKAALDKVVADIAALGTPRRSLAAE